METYQLFSEIIDTALLQMNHRRKKTAKVKIIR
jgi:hypothetical protein